MTSNFTVLSKYQNILKAGRGREKERERERRRERGEKTELK